MRTAPDVNSYSKAWFQTFLLPYSQEHTDAEIAFLTRQLPLSSYREVLDLCCGAGRHALRLSSSGYRVTGVDLDEAMLDAARQQAVGEAYFIKADMRDLTSLPGKYDAIINLWQSFGYFDADTNLRVLRAMHDKLHPAGRVVLDIYNRDFFIGRDGERTIQKDGVQIIEKRRLADDRLTVTLNYGPSAPPDVFSWQLYTPEEICAIAKGVGFHTQTACAWFDESQPVTPDTQRMQLVFEKAP